MSVDDVLDIDIRCYVSGPQIVVSVAVAGLTVDLVLRDEAVPGPFRAVAAFLVAVVIHAALLQTRLHAVHGICGVASLVATGM